MERLVECEYAVLGNFVPDPGSAEVIRHIKDRVTVVRYNGLDYVLKQYLPEDTQDRIESSRKLQRFVNANMNFPDTTIPTPDGRLCTQCDGIGYDLTEYVKTSESGDGVIYDPISYFGKIGAFVGRLHNTLTEYEETGTSIPQSGLKIDTEGKSTMESLLRQYERAGIDGPWRTVINNKIAVADSLHQIETALDKLPVTLVHGDIHKGNLLVGTDGEIAAIIDFIQAGMFYRCYEVMRAAVQTNRSVGCVDLDPRNLRSFLEGYLGEHPLEEVELNNMLILYIYTQANDTSFYTPDIIKSGQVEYPLFRYQSLCSLNRDIETLQKCIDQVGERNNNGRT